MATCPLYCENKNSCRGVLSVEAPHLPSSSMVLVVTPLIATLPRVSSLPGLQWLGKFPVTLKACACMGAYVRQYVMCLF